MLPNLRIWKFLIILFIATNISVLPYKYVLTVRIRSPFPLKYHFLMFVRDHIILRVTVRLIQWGYGNVVCVYMPHLNCINLT